MTSVWQWHHADMTGRAFEGVRLPVRKYGTPIYFSIRQNSNQMKPSKGASVILANLHDDTAIGFQFGALLGRLWSMGIFVCTTVCPCPHFCSWQTNTRHVKHVMNTRTHKLHAQTHTQAPTPYTHPSEPLPQNTPGVVCLIKINTRKFFGGLTPRN